MPASVNIKTSHNIILSYDQAGLPNRIGAFAIDLLLVYMTVMLLLSIGYDSVIYYIFVVPLFLCYHLTCEIITNGQSIGKRIMKLRVVALDGGNLDLRSILIRWAFRLLDIGATFGLLAIFMISTSGVNQRLGDLIARTTVIYVGKKGTFGLDMLTQLDQLSHEVVFPQVRQYNDEDMLVVKDMIKALQEQANDKTRHAAQLLADKLDRELEITDRPTSLPQYFRQLVQDYVLLTR